MSRCKGCDRLLEPTDMISFKEDEVTGKRRYEDMCSWCRASASSQYNYTSDKRYTFEDIGGD